MTSRPLKLGRDVVAWFDRHRGAGVLELALVPIAAWLVLAALRVSLWTQPHTPDSEFYFTLAVFGDEVTDPAVESAYYWTRVGVVVPLRGLISVFGVEGGYAVWHLLLIAVALVPMYELVKRLLSRPAAIGAALFVLLNLVFLTTVGNTYVSSTVVPLLIAESALLVGAATATSRTRRTVSVLLAGVCVGWIVACNQLALILAVCVAAAGLIAIPRKHWKNSITGVLAAAWAAASVFLALVFAGAIVFPRFNWWATTRHWVDVLKVSDYHSADLAWLRTNPALLVPVILAAGAVVLGLRRADDPVRKALRVSGLLGFVGIGFGLWYQFVAKAGFLEFQAYSPFLWGTALPAGGLAVGAIVTAARRSAAAALLAGVAMVGGAWVPLGDGFDLWPIGVLAGSVALATIVLVGAPSSRAALIAPLAACAVLPVVVQTLQAATPRSVVLKYARVDYAAVLRGDDFRADHRQDVAVARWVLGQPNIRKFMVWTSSPGLGSSGAMLFLGPNSASLWAEITPQGRQYVQAARPSHIIMITQNAAEMAQVRAGVNSLATTLTDGPCRVFPREGQDFDVRVCIAGVQFGTRSG